MPQGEKNKLTKEQRKEILALHGKESGHKVAECFGVSHTMVYKIWKKKTNGLQKPNPIDLGLVQKFVDLFKKVTTHIPENERTTFTESLKEFEKQRIKELATGGIGSE